MSMSSALFHYTNVDGLLGILSSKSIFATHYRYLNDSSEGMIIKKLILPIFELEIAKLTPKLIERRWLKPDAYHRYGAEIHRLQAERQFESMLHTTNDITPFFIASFCRHSKDAPSYNDGLLSQWRGYAGTAGFAIEFDEGEFDTLRKAEHAQHAYSIIKTGDVIYNNYDSIFDGKVYEGMASELMKDLFLSTKNIDISDILEKKTNLDDVYPAYVQTAPFLKAASFEEEREYRIAAICFRKKSLNKEEKRPEKKIKFRSRNNLVTPYIELFKDVDRPLNIVSVLVGPHAHQSRQADAVKMALEQHNIDCPVRISSMPFQQ